MKKLCVTGLALMCASVFAAQPVTQEEAVKQLGKDLQKAADITKEPPMSSATDHWVETKSNVTELMVKDWVVAYHQGCLAAGLQYAYVMANKMTPQMINKQSADCLNGALKTMPDDYKSVNVGPEMHKKGTMEMRAQDKEAAKEYEAILKNGSHQQPEGPTMPATPGADVES